METPQSTKKGGSLNDFLAIERTAMANDRTLLSFIRTALYFAVAGITLHQLVSTQYGFLFQAVFFLLAVFILAAGLYKYRRQRQRLEHGRKQVSCSDLPVGVRNNG